jgi:hypothetical protein
MTLPLAPVAKHTDPDGQATALSAFVVPDDCAGQLAPPFEVPNTVPLAPTATHDPEPPQETALSAFVVLDD